MHKNIDSAPIDLLSSYHSQLKPIRFPENNLLENTPQNFKAKSMNLMKNSDENSSKMKSINGGNSHETGSTVSGYPSINREVNEGLLAPLQVTNEQLMDRAGCFEMFRKSYRKNELMEEHKQILKQRFDEGKVLGDKVNNARRNVNLLKNQIEELRKEKAIIGLMDSQGDNNRGLEEEKLAEEIEKNKMMYFLVILEFIEILKF